MRSLIFILACVGMFAVVCVYAQNAIPTDSTGRPADSLKSSTPKAPQKQPPVIMEHSIMRILTGIPPDTVVIPYDHAPKMISQGPAEYPRMAKAGRFTGAVTVKAFVDSTGTVRKAVAVKCNRPGMGFEEAAVISAYKSTFEPATYKDKPVGVWFTYEVKFE